jgi:hypothetical protein
MAKIEVNRLSKIYNQNSKEQLTFDTVNEAKRFFLSKQAIETFDNYCLRQQFQLANGNKSLHWTISFELDTDPDNSVYTPFSDLWRDTKNAITSRDEWFVEKHHPLITHEADHLF